MKIHRGLLCSFCVAVGIIAGLLVAAYDLLLHGEVATAATLSHLAIWPGAAALILFSFIPSYVDVDAVCRTDVPEEPQAKSSPAQKHRNFGSADLPSMVEEV